MIGKGDLVRHPVKPAWGVGKVMRAAQGGNLLVKFEQAGNKLLQPDYARLVKIPDNELLYLVIREVRIRRGRSVKSIRVIPVIKSGTV